MSAEFFSELCSWFFSLVPNLAERAPVACVLFKSHSGFYHARFSPVGNILHMYILQMPSYIFFITEDIHFSFKRLFL